MYVRAAFKTEELRRCWQHSLACAVLSETLARSAGVHEQQAYTAGLMHDIGRLAILVAYPEQYIGIVREAAFRCIDLLDFERECLRNAARRSRLLAGTALEPARILSGYRRPP